MVRSLWSAGHTGLAVSRDPALVGKAAIPRLIALPSPHPDRAIGLTSVLDWLRCPICDGALKQVATDRSTVRCHAGHAFDTARQGYLTLGRGRSRHPGDTAEMVLARERILSAGILNTVVRAVGAAVPGTASAILDVGAGTGHYLTHVVAAMDDRCGIGTDTSKPALRRLAKAHPRIAAIGADVTEPLPILDGVIDVCLIVFAPRPVDEISRVLSRGGMVVVVTPNQGHLAELVTPMGMLEVPPGKVSSVTEQFGNGWAVRTEAVRETTAVNASVVADLALMGPAGFHAEESDLRRRAEDLVGTGTIDATVDVSVTTMTRTS